MIENQGKELSASLPLFDLAEEWSDLWEEMCEAPLELLRRWYVCCWGWWTRICPESMEVPKLLDLRVWLEPLLSLRSEEAGSDSLPLSSWSFSSSSDSLWCTGSFFSLGSSSSQRPWHWRCGHGEGRRQKTTFGIWSTVNKPKML